MKASQIEIGREYVIKGNYGDFVVGKAVGWKHWAVWDRWAYQSSAKPGVIMEYRDATYGEFPHDLHRSAGQEQWPSNQRIVPVNRVVRLYDDEAKAREAQAVREAAESSALQDAVRVKNNVVARVLNEHFGERTAWVGTGVQVDPQKIVQFIDKSAEVEAAWKNALAEARRERGLVDEDEK